MLTFKKAIILSFLALLPMSFTQANTLDTAAVKEAKIISQVFVKTLKTELKKAMVSGGPLKAITVCNTKASSITAQIAEKYNVKLSRVSLKNRNPQNKPNAWQKSVLENFDMRVARGENIKKMTYSKVVEHDGKKQLHFMKAMPTGDGCLVCHGKNIVPAVKEKIARLYPDDKATGYEKGQVRGAIVIIKDLY